MPAGAVAEIIMVPRASALISMMMGSPHSSGREGIRLSMALFRSE